ncbi:hypothetical protein [Clostridium sp.]|uniref:hypothetical protein n=1 Tax=Clostridium sp. TaxID=1506 RepID=UPI003D6CE83E
MKLERELKGIIAGDLLCKKVKYDDGVGLKDIVAIVIAQFQMLIPVMIGVALIMSLILFILL